MTASPWTQALVFAVTGEVVRAAETEAPDIDGIVAEARARNVAEIAARRRGADEAWPLPLPDDVRVRLPSMAQFAAALQLVVERLDLAPHAVRSRRPLDVDERRLMADHPPHFGSVG